MNKNKKFNISILILLLIIIPQISLASFISLESSNKKVKVDETFNVSIYIDPVYSVAYTTQVSLDFPADLVSVESFDYAPSWVPVNQTGYDLIDNDNGKIIKTAGYPSGFNEKILLGTLVLKAKKAGPIDLRVNKESFVLDIDNKNTLTDSESISIPSRNSLRDILSNLWNSIFS